MSDSTLASSSNSLPSADALFGKDSSSFSGFSSDYFDIPKYFQKHMDEYGLTLTAWIRFYEAAGSALSTEEALRAERLLNDAWKDRLLDHFFQRFINRTDVWYRQWCNGPQYGYRCIKPDGEYKSWEDGYIPVSKQLLLSHFAGEITISIPAIAEDGKSKWCCWDSDDADGRLFEIHSLLTELGFHPILEGRRAGRDGHLWLFFEQPIKADDLIEFKDLIHNEAGITIRKGDQLEFFPKSADKQSQIRLPLGIHRKPGANNIRGWFSDAPRSYDDCDAQDVIESQLYWLSQQPRDTASGITRLAIHSRSKSKPINPPSYSKPFLRGTTQERAEVDIRPYIGSCRKVGRELMAACPLCRLEGRDKHGDNLRVSLDGLKINCVLGGPNTTHKTGDIYRALGV